MNLLEALVALVILGLSAVGYLEVFQSGARSVRQADDWERTVAVAESTMEAALLGDALQAQQATGTSGGDVFTRAVTVTPWNTELSDVVVEVTSPRGTRFALHRLVRRP